MDSGDSLSAGDIRTRLSDAINDANRGTGHWAYYIDHFGDGESGLVVYSCDGDTCRAPYEISPGGDGQTSKCIINTDDAEDVIPRTVYEVEQDEADHIASMESLRTDKLYGDVVPTYERFIAKSARDKASASDFAGKGKSFPILKAEDVMAAASSLGRAGAGNLDTATIKANIIRIAKRKGFPLPKAWDKGAKESAEPVDLNAISTQLHEAGKRHSADDMKALQTIHDTANALGAACPDTFRMAGAESAAPEATAGLRLVECCPFSEDIEIDLREAGGGDGKKIRLISPGKGSSAWYTVEALKKAAADKIFRAGTPMRIDHPTESDQRVRPEGSVKDWGAVLKYDAEWMESYIGKSGKDYGAGLYSEVMPFSDHAQTINEKGPFAAVSICANGAALIESGKTVMRDGVPVLKEFTSAEGVDMVTRAGARGLFLQESGTATASASGSGGSGGGASTVASRNATNTIHTVFSEAAPAAQIPTQEVSGMDADELKALKESNARLMERAVYQDAVILARKLLDDVTIHESAKQMVCENVIGTEGAWKYLPRKDGALDSAKFGEMISNEAKRVGKVLKAAGAGRSTFLDSVAEAPRPEEIQAREAARQREEADSLDVFGEIMGNKEAAKFAAKGRAA